MKAVTCVDDIVGSFHPCLMSHHTGRRVLLVVDPLGALHPGPARLDRHAAAPGRNRLKPSQTIHSHPPSYHPPFTHTDLHTYTAIHPLTHPPSTYIQKSNPRPSSCSARTRRTGASPTARATWRMSSTPSSGSRAWPCSGTLTAERAVRTTAPSTLCTRCRWMSWRSWGCGAKCCCPLRRLPPPRRHRHRRRRRDKEKFNAAKKEKSLIVMFRFDLCSTSLSLGRAILLLKLSTYLPTHLPGHRLLLAVVITVLVLVHPE